MIDEGKHRAKATSWAIGKAQTGNYQIGIEFDLLDLPGHAITYYGSFSDKAYEFTIKAMRACGWQGADLAVLEGLDANEVVLVVEHEEYNGKVQAKVKWVNSQGGLAMANALQGDELAAFAASMRGKILAADPGAARRQASPSRSNGAAKPASAPQKPPQGVHPLSDDIPF